MDDEHHEPRYEGIGDDSTDPEYTNDSGDDCGAIEAGPTTDDASEHTDGQPTDGSQSKRQKKDRRPSKLGTVKEEFTEVAKNGLPTTPEPSPGHRLDQHREPKASRSSKFAQPPLHEAAQPIQVPRSIHKHKPLRE